jgi:hypothetical protein
MAHQPQARRARVARRGTPGATEASKDSGQKAIGGRVNAAWVLPAIRPNHIWSYDFVSVRTRAGGQIRILNLVR